MILRSTKLLGLLFAFLLFSGCVSGYIEESPFVLDIDHPRTSKPHENHNPDNGHHDQKPHNEVQHEQPNSEQKEDTNNHLLDDFDPDKFIQNFLQGQFGRIYSQTSESFQKSITLDHLITLVLPFNEGVDEYSLLTQLQRSDGTKYIWIDQDEEKVVSVLFDHENKIDGLWITPITTYPDRDNILSKKEYILPFNGEWYTLWGGNNEVVNYHYKNEGQRYAYDFVITKNGSTFEGDPSLNESYYSFGQEVIVPSDGIVMKVVDDVRDNDSVGYLNTHSSYGNYIIIDHGDEEYSLIAHLMYGSIGVNEGELVSEGEVIGLVGNSGNSGEPHLHFQLMDHPDPDIAQSIRIRFKGNRDIIQGDLVSN